MSLFPSVFCLIQASTPIIALLCNLSLTARGIAWVGSKFTLVLLFHLKFAKRMLCSMAYVEMRMILVSMLWNFDYELCDESKNWLHQKVYLVWRKDPLMVRLVPRRDLKGS